MTGSHRLERMSRGRPKKGVGNQHPVWEAYLKKYYPERYTDITTSYRYRAKEERSKLYHKFKSGCSCAVCGYDKQSKNLHFHHVEANSKSFTIGRIDKFGKEEWFRELEKCICLCNHCHFKVHVNGKI